MSEQQFSDLNSAFHHLTKQMNEYVAQRYGFYYLQPGEDKGQWRSVVPYKPELEEELIKQTQLFVRTSIPDISIANNPSFVKALLFNIADFLSKYTAQNPEHRSRHQAKKALTKKLISTNFVLQHKQPVTSETKKQRKRIKKENAQRIHSQVKDMFREIQRDCSRHWGR